MWSRTKGRASQQAGAWDANVNGALRCHWNSRKYGASTQTKDFSSHLRAKIEELETNSKIQNFRDLCRIISYFKNE